MTFKAQFRFCGCKLCRLGLHRSGYSKAKVKRVIRAARHKDNLLARQQRDEEIGRAGMPYTD